MFRASQCVDDERQRLTLQRRAHAGFASNYGMGSYLWVCDLLDLEPAWIRRRMIRVLNSGDGKLVEGADEYELELASDLLSA